MNYWTLEEDTKLMELHAQNMTFAAMGKLLNRTKNSCISRSRILKLTPRPTAKHPEPIGKKTHQAFVTQKPVHSKELPEWEQKDGIDLLELTHKSCRWPSDTKPIKFCGCDKFRDKSYCLPHYMRSMPPEKRQAFEKELFKSGGL